MKSNVWFAGLFVLVSACAPPARPAADASPNVASSSKPGVKATPTPVPGRVTQNSGGGKFVTLSESTLDPKSSRSRTLYDVVALKSVVTSTYATLDRPHITFHERSGKVFVADAPEAKI